METKSEYDIQAEDFLKVTGTKFQAQYIKHDKYFSDDEEKRDIYKITLVNKNGTRSFTFGQSIKNCGKAPKPYDVLACLTKYDPGTFENFVSDYGYSIETKSDIMKAKRVYGAVIKEFEMVEDLFTDEEIEILSEIV